jgi:hypothetical protein
MPALAPVERPELPPPLPLPLLLPELGLALEEPVVVVLPPDVEGRSDDWWLSWNKGAKMA